MTCHDVSFVMLAFVEGRLDEPQRVEVQRHLAECDACRMAAADQSDVARVLASRSETPVPAWFAARVAARLEDEGGWFGVVDWRWLSVRVAPVAAALLLAAAVVVERGTSQATVQANAVSWSQAMESWAGGDTGRTPATAVLWKQDVSDESMLLTVLAAPADATIGGQSDER